MSVVKVNGKGYSLGLPTVPPGSSGIQRQPFLFITSPFFILLWKAPVKISMSDKVFFPRSFLGTNIDFGQESKWTVSQKLSEEVKQQDESCYQTFRPQSRSIAKFLCHEVGKPDNVMIMKIMMQYDSFPTAT